MTPAPSSYSSKNSCSSTSACCDKSYVSVSGFSSGSISTVPSYSATSTLGTTSYYSTNDISLSMGSDWDSVLHFMTEEEIIKVIDIITPRMGDDISSVIRHIVRSIHLSEEFLLKYADYLRVNDILRQHAREFNSGEYSSLALYYEAKER